MWQIARPWLVLAIVAMGCGDDAPGVDAGVLAHCEFEPLPPTGNSTGTAQAGPVTAGAAEGVIDLPIGSALGCYTARAQFLGASTRVDIRRVEQSGSFNPSVGYETPPPVKAVAISAGGETVVLIKIDGCCAYDGVTHDVAANLGPEFAGKVLFAVSHSHSALAQYSGDPKMGLGLGEFRRKNYEAVVAATTAVAQQALAARRPARVGVALDPDFDPADEVSRDRRGENNALTGGERKDKNMFVIRVDGVDGVPIALVTVFGMHATVLGEDNPLASTDSSGSVERALEEAFDDPVVVMHMQGAGGDVSPAGRGGISCAGFGDTQPCYDFARVESIGRLARPIIMATWVEAGLAMQDSMVLEMVTRSVDIGPDPQNLSIRDGALSYATWDRVTPPDGEIYDGTGAILSPIDEFNAPSGAGLCGEANGALFPAAEIVGSYDACTGGNNDEPPCPYRSCVMLDTAGPLLGEILELPNLEVAPVCATTRTTVSALRLGDTMIATLPGEPVTLLADKVREKSPFAPEKTIVIGYAQGHLGYLLTPEDWLLGGYEPSINVWGPLEGEYIAEQAAAMMVLAASDAREDAAAGGTDRFTTPQGQDGADVPAPDPAPLAGTVPSSIPADVYVRQDVTLAGAQPPATIARLESAHFVWIGEDPQAGTPRVTLQRVVGPAYVDVERRSGRVVADRDLLVAWTPIPLRRAGTDPRTHYWVVEWQAVAVSGGIDNDLEDRAGLPTGSYRFHVEGTGYTLDSNEFQVNPGAVGVAASRSGATISAALTYHAPLGYRLLDLAATSNAPVPLRRGPVQVELLLTGGATTAYPDTALDANGNLSLDAGATADQVIEVRVTDRFGNTGSGAI